MRGWSPIETKSAYQEPIEGDDHFAPEELPPKEVALTKATWETLDNEPVCPVSTTPAEPVAKQRLESFETTDQFWMGSLLQLSETDKIVQTPAGEETQAMTPPERASPRKEVRRFSGKGSEKLKNKIKKLKAFWKEKQRMMPHLFKVVFQEEGAKFELHDLSLKGAAGGKMEDEQAHEDRDLDEDDYLSVKLSARNHCGLFIE